MGFDEFINKPVSEKVLLLEVEPAVELDTWTISGAGPEYYATFDEMLVNEYAAVSKVCEDGGELEEGSGVGLLDPGQWYYDLANKRIYVRTTNSSDPNTKVMAAYFKVYFATTGKVFNSNYYQPRVKEDGVRLSAGTERIDSGSLVLVNSDGWFDVKMVKWVWRGADCAVRLGGDDLVYSEYNIVAGLKVCSLEYRSEEVVLELEGAKSDWNIQLPINEFYTSEEILRPDAVGTYQNWTKVGDEKTYTYECVNEVGGTRGDRFTTYMKLTTGAKKESFNLPASTIPDGATINFVAVYVVGRVKYNADHRIKFLIRTHDQDYTHDVGKTWGWCLDKYPPNGEKPGGSWHKKAHVWTVNPFTTDPWTKDEIDALEVGVEGDVKVEYQELYVTQVYVAVNYSVMEQYGEGKAVPIVYGEGVEYSPVLIDDTVEHGKFGLADKTVQTLEAVDKVWYEDEELTVDVHYTVESPGYCTITILNAGPVIDDPAALKVRVNGAKVSDIPEKSGDDSVMVRAPDIVRHLFQVVLGWGVNKIDVDSFDVARGVATQANSLVINEKMYLKDIVERLVQSVKGVFGQDKDGKLFMNIWSADDTGALELSDEDILEFGCRERDVLIARRVVVKYGRDPDSGEYQVVSAGDLWAELMFPRTDVKVFETTLVEKGDAQELAIRLLPSFKVPIMDCEVVTKLQAAKVEVGDKVKITRSRAPSLSGSFAGEVFQVKGVSRETGNRIRLMLEPNKYFGCSMSTMEDKGEYDDKKGILKAASLITNDIKIKSDKKVEGRNEALVVTLGKIMESGDFRGHNYDENEEIILLHSADKKLHSDVLDGANRKIKDKIDKVEGAIEDTTFLIKTDKVVATSIQLDEALRRSNIAAVAVGPNAAQAAPTLQSYPVNYVVSMYSSGGHAAYDLASFNDIGALGFLGGNWQILTWVAGTELDHEGTNGDFETGDPPTEWTALNGATLSSVSSPVYHGSCAMKIAIAGEQSWGGAEQEVNLTSIGGLFGYQCVKDFSVWLRNGDADNVQMKALFWWPGNGGNPQGWYQINGTVTKTQTNEYQEAYLLRQPIHYLVPKVKIQFIVNGTGAEYGYVDYAFVRPAESSVHIIQAAGANKDFKVRSFIEQAGT